MVGTFHPEMGYLKMLGKKMEGSGFSDVLLEANLASSGSISGGLAGENYSRAVNCHKTVAKFLHRLLFIEFLKTEKF